MPIFAIKCLNLLPRVNFCCFNGLHLRERETVGGRAMLSLHLIVLFTLSAGGCRKNTQSGSLRSPPQQTVTINESAMDNCWEQCMSFPPTSSGLECVGALFGPTTCTGYLGDTLISVVSTTTNTLTTTMIKSCFDGESFSLCFLNHFTFIPFSQGILCSCGEGFWYFTGPLRSLESWEAREKKTFHPCFMEKNFHFSTSSSAEKKWKKKPH